MRDLVAAGTMRLGIERLIDRYPLLGGIVASWSLKEDASVQTMGVGFSEVEGWLLYYAPTYVTSLPQDQLVGVLLHEVRHVVYEHVFQRPEDFPDENALRTAQETVVNENLPEPLPREAVLLSQFPFLPPDECTEHRYRRLARHSLRRNNSSLKNRPGPCPAKSRGKGHSLNNSSASTSADEKSARVLDSRKPSNCRSSHSSGTGQHDRWDLLRKNEETARSSLEGAVDSLVQNGVVPSDYEKILITKQGSDRGEESGSSVSAILRGMGARHIRWQALLRRFVGRALCRQPYLGRPPRRYPELTGIVPGRSSTPSRPKIMAVIDTSASMSDRVLEELSTELLRLSRTHEVHVVECDSVIHRHYPLRKRIQALCGRGGTSFRPPFRKAFLQKLRPDLVIYLTDGHGDAPERAPSMPVLWLLTTDAAPPASWGRTIRIPVTEDL